MKKYLLSPSEASGTTIYIFAGLSVGSALLPWLCEKWQCLDRAIQLCSGGIFVLFGLLLWGPQLSIGEVKLLLFAVGFFCGAEMMCFTGAVQATTAAHSGLTLGVVNTLNMFGGAALQHIIGYALDLQWSGQLDAQGIRQYEALHYVVALSLLWGIIAACCLLSIRLGQRKLLIF
jgi:hypothetical protein